MLTISLDLLAEILSRLPIKCVLCFRCVSTTWCALIDSPEFSKLHLNHSLETDTNRMVILRETEYFQFKKHCFYCLDIDGSLYDRVATPKELKNPLKSSDFDTKILGSCNGVLLLSNDVDNVALWNPSTGKFKKLPVLSLGGKKEDEVVRFGFGYDVVNDDYKVVRIVQCLGDDVVGGGDSFSSDVNVYSLKSNAWKRVVEEFPYYLDIKEEPGIYLSGALHWVASSKMNTHRDNSQKLIVAFDLATEKCRVVPYPPCTKGSFMVRLEVLGGALCVCHFYCDELFVVNGLVWEYDMEHTDVWVMKEYGVEESWTMIKSIGPMDDDTGHTVVPLAYSKNGEEILVELDNRWFVWTSINKDTNKIVDIQLGKLRGFLSFYSCVYLGSLVQLGSSDDTSYLKKKFSHDKGGQRTKERKTSEKRGDDFLSKGFKLKL